MWKATSSQADKVHALWYRVDRFRSGRGYRLDDTNIAALEAALAKKQNEGGADGRTEGEGLEQGAPRSV